MNYLFLDVDGVLRLDKLEKLPLFSRESLIYLKEICLKTNCEIKLISDWKNDSKKLKNLNRVLKLFELEVSDLVLGSYENKGKSILEYIKKHPCEGYVVLDDDISVLGEIDEAHYVITHSGIGITEEIKNQVIKKFGEEYDLDNRIRR